MKCILKETKQKTTLKPRELVSWVSLFPAIVPHLGFQFAFKKKKKLFFFCKRVQETICQISGRPAFCVSGRTGHFFDSVPFLFSQGPKMGLLCLGLLSSVEAQGSHVGNPSAHTFREVELFSPLQADSAAGRSVVWPCTLPCSRPCSMPDFVSVAGSCTSELPPSVTLVALCSPVF